MTRYSFKPRSVWSACCCISVLSWTLLRGQPSPSFATSANPEALHGTVNVVIGNGQGLVVATDSRLSSNGVPSGSGAKLFQIDDHTVCAIAGFYSDTGPRTGAGEFPVFTTVPGIVNFYLAKRSAASLVSIQAKADELAGALIFSLELVDNVNRAAGQTSRAYRSEITVAGFDGDLLKVAKFDLVPDREGNRTIYNISNSSIQAVGPGLFSELAGIEDIGRAMLAQPSPFASSDPAVAHYLSSMRADDGKSMTVPDMRQLAGDIEFMTAQAHPNEVGGKLQIAVLSGGKVSSFDEPFSAKVYPLQPGVIGIMPRNFFNGFFFSFPASNTHPVLVEGSQFSNVQELPLDNLLVMWSAFTHCRFRYNGSIALLDSSNVIRDSVLVIGANVTDSNPFLGNIRRSFPDLVIKRSTDETR